MTRMYPSVPRVGVGVITFNEHGRALLIKRGNEPSKNLWSVPGGLVELGEKVTEAVRREVLEECNVHVEPKMILDVVDLILKDDEEGVRFHYVLIDYLADFLGGELTPQSDASDAGWFSEADLTELDIPEITQPLLAKAFQINKNAR